MQKIPSSKSVSLAELQNPEKAPAESGGDPVAVMRQGRVIGYFVPQSAVGATRVEYADSAEVKRALEENKDKHQPVLDYLKSR